MALNKLCASTECPKKKYRARFLAIDTPTTDRSDLSPKTGERCHHKFDINDYVGDIRPWEAVDAMLKEGA